MGKSIIVSQRFPAWMLARKPEHRVKLACYNISHATRFSRINREIIEGEQWKAWYPKLTLEGQNTQDEWSLAPRTELKDAQPSFKALGLQTGFVGQGVDTLIIDDPYASPQEAHSEAIRASVMMFWNDSAKVRLNDASNVVIMFHRYHLQDIAGTLIEQDGLVQNGGKWELLRYAMECDDPASDPLHRELGAKLTERYSDAWIDEQKAIATTWKGQFQGIPIAGDGLLFNIAKLRYCDLHEVPTLEKTSRGWDVAASEGRGDWTAGAKIARGADGLYYVLDCVRGQWEPHNRNTRIRQTAEMDGRTVGVIVPQDPGAAGIGEVRTYTQLLAGFNVSSERPSKDKETLASPFAAQVNGGNVVIVRGAWNREYVNEMRDFPQGKNDDQIDASATAFNKLTRPQLQSRIA
jgi:predicted phage terminase large subunit-like protein